MSIYKELPLKDHKPLEYSSKISCVWEGNDYKKLTISIGEEVCSQNMQEDGPNFEGIAFCVWSVFPECEIVLDFNPPLDWGNKFPIDYCKYGIITYSDRQMIDESNGEEGIKENSVNSKIQHYLRFLYRVWKMDEFYSHFYVEKTKKKYVDMFSTEYRKALESGNLLYTAPKKESEIKDYEGTITENHLEKWFVYYSNQAEMRKLVPSMGKVDLHDQFPCGLFYASKASDIHESTRIFNSGAFDLWGVDEDKTLCIYELKNKDNKKLGIISELFFYACLCRDFLYIGKRCYRKDYRGFMEFWTANRDENIRKPLVKAYFLVDRFHPSIDDRITGILTEMNKQEGGIIEFGEIRFNQDELVGIDPKGFVENLKKMKGFSVP